jgi:hypothetical protein
MPTMASITVKNAANADVIYNAATPSAGDRSQAVWRQNAAHAVIGFRPKFGLLTRDNSRKNGRVIEGSFSFPIVAEINGVDTLVATVPLTMSGTLPTNVDAAEVADAFVQFGNLLASSLVRSSAEEGYSPT